MDRTLNNLTDIKQKPEFPSISGIGLVTFAYLEETYEQYLTDDKELSEKEKKAFFQYGKCKYYWRKEGRGSENQYKQTIRILRDMEVFQ